MKHEEIVKEIIALIAEVYGFDEEDLSGESSLMNDVNIKGNPVEFLQLVQRLNDTFDIDLRASDIQLADLDDEEETGMESISDLAALVEDSMLG